MPSGCWARFRLRGTRRHLPRVRLPGFVRLELALEYGYLVFQEEFAFLEALQLDLVLRGALRQAGYDIVEIAVLYVQLVDSLLESFDVGGMYHGVILHTSETSPV